MPPSVRKQRRVLCVQPRFSPCFASFHHAMTFFPGASAFMPPQGILTIAAYLPASWDVRVVDENVTPITAEDLRWADAVMVSGMHVQRGRMAEIARLAHAAGKLAIAGGSSVSGCPAYHPDFDVLQVGELGDATDDIIRLLDDSVERPPEQLLLTTSKRLDIDDFPIPAYDKVNLNAYMVLNIQWGSGCPFTCEFCDIPELYGRRTRTKSVPRLMAELDAIMAQRPVGGIWFVDDNLIGDKKAARALMPHLVEWQHRNNYQMRLTGECTINLAEDTDLLEQMREAYFTDMFLGIETPDTETLKQISKRQNVRRPVVDNIETLNQYGIEVATGIIFGFDGEGEDHAERAIQFAREAAMPIVVLNVLYALPKTPLHRRLAAEGRLLDEEIGGSNIRFELPNEVIAAQLRRAVDELYNADAVFSRYRHQAVHTYPNRKPLALGRFPLSSPAVRFGARALGNVAWGVGVRSNYKRQFWRMAAELTAAGRIDHALYIGAMAHHFVKYREDVLSGRIAESTFSHRPGVLAAK